MLVLQQLEGMGYKITLEGTNLRLTWHGEGNPDPATVRPLLEELKRRKEEAVRWMASQHLTTQIFCFACFKKHGARARYRPHIIKPSAEFPGWWEYICQGCGSRSYARREGPWGDQG